MPDLIIYIILFGVLLLLEVIYFKIADRFNIIDKPNHRSSHIRVTIRGGGIIFPIAVLIWFIRSNLSFPFFVGGLLLISVISFIDDIIDLNSGIRSAFQFIAVGLLLIQLDLGIGWYYYPLLFILIVGTKNAYNFMDGINGITGSYSLITILSLLYINGSVIQFTDSTLLVICALSLCVFNFFNFRRKAKCFAGDVGSVSIAFIILFLIIKLIAASHNLFYVLLLLMYGLDTVTTIIFLLIRKENILGAHRTHLYQYLANERKWPHLAVSLLYGVVQLPINAILISFSFTVAKAGLIPLCIILLISGLLFILLRLGTEGQMRLMGRQQPEF